MIVPGGTFLEYTMHSNSRQVNLTQTHKLCSKSWMITGEINKTMERFNFNKRNQTMDENVDSYVTCLRTLAKTCNFCNTCGDSLICDRIIMGIRYEGYENSQADLLKVGKLTLKGCINICCSAEATEGHMKLMSSRSLCAQNITPRGQ